MSGVVKTKVAAEFATTRWSEIQAARTATPEHRQAVLENLARRYWKPVYCYLRARGQQDADARDITQDFFVEVILGRDLFGQAEPHRGRFRPYLLHCLKNFVRDWYRRERAQRRSPKDLMLSIHQWADSESSRCLPLALDERPEEVFHRKWAASLPALGTARPFRAFPTARCPPRAGAGGAGSGGGTGPPVWADRQAGQQPR